VSEPASSTQSEALAADESWPEPAAMVHCCAALLATQGCTASTPAGGGGGGTYGTPQAESWSHAHLVGHDSPPLAITRSFSAQIADTKAGSWLSVDASKFQKLAAPTKPRGQIMPATLADHGRSIAGGKSWAPTGLPSLPEAPH
jgi:hypothetical protein